MAQTTMPLDLRQSELLEQLDEWETCLTEDTRLRRLIPLEIDIGALTLSAAADAAALQESSFSRYFHHIVGTRFRDWKTALKVARALELLRNTAEDVEQIALRVGYQDGRSLRRATKRFTGASPRDFREQTER